MDTPIVGGSDEARAVVLAELAAFDEATGGGRTPVSRVEFTDLGGPYGTYHRLSHTVLLERTLPTSTDTSYHVALVLRHELCHALNQREDLHQEREVLYDSIGEQLLLHDDVCRTDRCLRDEAFAQTCHAGPWISLFAGDGCDDDPFDTTALRHQAEVLWVAADEPLPSAVSAAWVSVDLAGYGATAPIERVWIYTSSERPEVLKIVWGDERSEAFVDRSSGDAVDGSFGFDWHLADPPPGLDPHVERVDNASAWSEDGPFVGLAIARDVHGPDDLVRHVWHDGDRWALVGDGCQQPGVWAQPFATDRVYAVRVDGTRVQWAPVSDSR